MKSRENYVVVASIGILVLLGAIIFRTESNSTAVTARQASHVESGVISQSIPSRVGVSYGRANVGTGKPRLVEAYGKLPMAFEANQGQTDGRVKFLSRGSGYTVFLTANEAVLALQKPSGDESSAEGNPQWGNHDAIAFAVPSALKNPELGIEQARGRESAAPAVLRMKLVGAKTEAKLAGVGKLSGKSNYFIGNDPKKWHTQVPTYARVRYQNAYPGIDLVYYGHQGQLEYDFVVSPGASAKAINFRISGQDRNAPLRIDDDGNLVVALNGVEVCFHKPVVYQPAALAGEATRPVDGRYLLKGKNEVGFEIAAFDRTKPLVIDPTLSYSTYLGGSFDDQSRGIGVDSGGNAYVTGFTLSTDFPTANPLQSSNHGHVDAFVAAFDPTGGTLLYSTYLGGSGNDFARAIAVDSVGDAYVTGQTSSPDFPTSNPLQLTNHGGSDVFVTALDPTGSTLLYSTYLGGRFDEVGFGIAVDRRGNAYVTGETTSFDFPTSNPLQATNHGGSDAFVAALDATGGTLLYSTYLGGSSSDYGQGIAVDCAGDAFVTGYTSSQDFPTANPLQLYQGGFDAFVTALDPTGGMLLYSTYLGGSSDDYGFAIAVDSAGNSYVTGATYSSDFPTSNPLQPTNGGSADAFVAALDPAGATLLYSTYLGGGSDDTGFGIAVDSAGDAFVTGYTSSTNFPTSNPLQPTNHGGMDAFVTAIDPVGATLLYSTYLGGTSNDLGFGIAVDGIGNVYVAGNTLSTNFPTSNPLQATNHGGVDAFVAKIAP